MAKKSAKAFIHFQKGRMNKAGTLFLKIANKFPESNVYGKNLWNAAWCFNNIDSLAKAEQVYNQILLSTLTDNELDNTRGIYETHANYKHYSCRKLADYAYQRLQYRKCMQWLDSADFRHPYYNDNVKEKMRAKFATDQMRSLCHEQLGNPDSALLVILPYCLMKSPWSKQLPSERALELTDKYFNRDTIAAMLEAGSHHVKKHPTHIDYPFGRHMLTLVPYDGGTESMKPEKFEKTVLYHWLCGVE